MFFHSDLCLSADILVSESRRPLLTVVTLFFLHSLTYIFPLLYMVLLIHDFFYSLQSYWLSSFQYNFLQGLSCRFLFFSKSVNALSSPFQKYVDLSLPLFCLSFVAYILFTLLLSHFNFVVEVVEINIYVQFTIFNQKPQQSQQL